MLPLGTPILGIGDGEWGNESWWLGRVPVRGSTDIREGVVDGCANATAEVGSVVEADVAAVDTYVVENGVVELNPSMP